MNYYRALFLGILLALPSYAEAALELAGECEGGINNSKGKTTTSGHVDDKPTQSSG